MESLASLPVFSSRRAQGMELSGHGGDMAIPISSVHDSPPLHHHHHHHNQVLSNGPPLPPPPPPPLLVLPVASGGATEEQQQCGGRKAAAKYRECLKNHAASIGGNATDGCGEFMPSGEEGSLEALKCSACGCHRNFHRKEAEGEEQLPSPLEYLRPLSLRGSDARKVAVGSAPRFLLPGPNHYHQFLPRVAAPHGMIMPLQQQQQQQTSDSEEMEVARPAALMMKKRFRTKFTAEQKEKMLGFAEKAGWRLQKQEDSVVQQFCQEIGVKRRVLKVWMHNNKHNLAKKHPPPPHLSPL